MSTQEIIEQIIELARWAPSGDNSQPWRFNIVSPLHVKVYGLDKRDFYDRDGHSQQISMGAMLETFAIAATSWGLRVQVSLAEIFSEFEPIFDLHLSHDKSIVADPLVGSIRSRSVQRREFSTKALDEAALSALQRSVGPGYFVAWKSSLVDRLRMALMLFYSAKIRLISPEAYVVHKNMIRWDAQFSEEGIPDQALGAPRFLLPSMRFVLADWQRVQFSNRFLAGTWMPRLLMDFMPAIACAGHFAIAAANPPQTFDDRIEAGRRIQRFWLTVTSLGLCMQPAITPLVFARYAREQAVFPLLSRLSKMAHKVGDSLDHLWSPDIARRAVFMGRVGHGEAPKARSERLSVQALQQLPSRDVEFLSGRSR